MLSDGGDWEGAVVMMVLLDLRMIMEGDWEIPSTLKGRGLGRDSNIRSGGDLVETVEFGLGYKVEISVGSVLDNVPTSDENGSDIKARKRLNGEEKREREGNWRKTQLLMEIMLTIDNAGRRLRREEKGKEEDG
ncbi:hypothetical protein U1Q18_001430 [Sarracenia purpurea var. burkii]